MAALQAHSTLRVQVLHNQTLSPAQFAILAKRHHHIRRPITNPAVPRPGAFPDSRGLTGLLQGNSCPYINVRHRALTCPTSPRIMQPRRNANRVTTGVSVFVVHAYFYRSVTLAIRLRDCKWQKLKLIQVRSGYMEICHSFRFPSRLQR
jgi:hypothetical protein